jgi:hypothetical protein
MKRFWKNEPASEEAVKSREERRARFAAKLEKRRETEKAAVEEQPGEALPDEDEDDTPLEELDDMTAMLYIHGGG